MFYMKAERYNGCLHFETLAGLSIDESMYLDESEFLRESANLTEHDDSLFGIVSVEVQSILHSVYK